MIADRGKRKERIYDFFTRKRIDSRTDRITDFFSTDRPENRQRFDRELRLFYLGQDTRQRFSIFFSHRTENRQRLDGEPRLFSLTEGEGKEKGGRETARPTCFSADGSCGCRCEGKKKKKKHRPQRSMLFFIYKEKNMNRHIIG
jgi:hypothetical protein